MSLANTVAAVLGHVSPAAAVVIAVGPEIVGLLHAVLAPPAAGASIALAAATASTSAAAAVSAVSASSASAAAATAAYAAAAGPLAASPTPLLLKSAEHAAAALLATTSRNTKRYLSLMKGVRKLLSLSASVARDFVALTTLFAAGTKIASVVHQNRQRRRDAGIQRDGDNKLLGRAEEAAIEAPGAATARDTPLRRSEPRHRRPRRTTRRMAAWQRTAAAAAESATCPPPPLLSVAAEAEALPVESISLPPALPAEPLSQAALAHHTAPPPAALAPAPLATAPATTPLAPAGMALLACCMCVLAVAADRAWSRKGRRRRSGSNVRVQKSFTPLRHSKVARSEASEGGWSTDSASSVADPVTPNRGASPTPTGAAVLFRDESPLRTTPSGTGRLVAPVHPEADDARSCMLVIVPSGVVAI